MNDREQDPLDRAAGLFAAALSEQVRLLRGELAAVRAEQRRQARLAGALLLALPGMAAPPQDETQRDRILQALQELLLAADEFWLESDHQGALLDQAQWVKLDRLIEQLGVPSVGEDQADG